MFGTLGLFDAHQDTDYGRKPVIVCHDPAVPNAIRDSNGVWQTPEGLAQRQAAARHLPWYRDATAAIPAAVGGPETIFSPSG